MPAFQREKLGLLLVVITTLVWSGITPHDRFTWFLEVLPILVGAPLLISTLQLFQLTTLTYRLLAFHAIILCIGGHYTYAEVPLGFWAQDMFGFERNHYDRIGHFAQGFVPAILAREILLRRSPLVQGKWIFFLVTSICLSFSALYEIFEWGTAVFTGEAATAFLGTQGDEWDTQWDMFMALIGAISSQVLLSETHDGQLSRFSASSIIPQNRQSS
ncbi:MAG: DUF2238 domain-containing protein [Nitrospirales bacterium]